MQIREATEQDIPEILGVLRASLGETSSKKTENIWKHKHLNNPFGKSLVLVAIDDDIIIGVRALMKWRWGYGDVLFSTLRAVDTATHPSHQGKGVFKKLTLEAIEIAKKQGGNFIFNTPNSQSLPGYLKMGWEEVDKIKIRVVPANPFLWRWPSTLPTYSVNLKNSDTQRDELFDKSNKTQIKGNSLYTVKTSEYLSWRYETNPIQQYDVMGDKDFYLAAYIKEHKFFRELRVTEHICTSKLGHEKIKNSIDLLVKKFGAKIVTSSLSFRYSIGLTGNFGPVLTLRELDLNEDLRKEFLQINNWGYTLGDLELY